MAGHVGVLHLLRCAGLDWTMMDWTMMDWTVMDWAFPMDMTKGDWTGLDWTLRMSTHVYLLYSVCNRVFCVCIATWVPDF